MAVETRSRLASHLTTLWEAVAARKRVAGPESLTRAELYAKARQLGVEGRSRMAKDDLAEAVRGSEQSRWYALRMRPIAHAALAVAVLRRPSPARALVLSLTLLATGALGLLVAMEIAPGEDVQPLLTAGQPISLATVTGPGGARTVAVIGTGHGGTRLVPVRIVRTVTGPGPEKLETSVRQRTDTEVVTSVEPVTVVVTNREEVTVTETVVLEVTTTVSTGKTAKTKP
jgi:hypothetical protein